MTAKYLRIERHFWKNIKGYYYLASKAYLTKEFSIYMEQLEKLSRECYQYLMEANLEKLAHSYFKGNKYNIMTAKLKDAR